MEDFKTQRHLITLCIAAVCLSIISCNNGESASTVLDESPPPLNTSETLSEKEVIPVNSDDTNPCALSNAEVSAILNETVKATYPQGNWGVASTCTYATESAPTGIRLSSAMSSDLSTDRLYEDSEEITDLGDEAVWGATASTLAVVDRSKNKLLRIGIGVEGSKEKQLELARAIALAALSKL